MKPNITIFSMVLGTMLAVPTHSYAINELCVHLSVGSGYAARMRMETKPMLLDNPGEAPKFMTDWSRWFYIGQHECQSLNDLDFQLVNIGRQNLYAGQKILVRVEAMAGKSKVCGSYEHDGKLDMGSVTFQASGTTLNVKCEMFR